MNVTGLRTRWAAIGAAVAVTLGAGGFGLVSATSPDGATAYVPIEPCRVTDTRSAADLNVGPRNTPLGSQETYVISAHGNNGRCIGIPASATGLQLNVTALNATAPSFITVWASGVLPIASSLNPRPNQPPIPNAVTTGLAADGKFSVYNNAGSVDIIVDVVGYYADHRHDDRYYTKAEVGAQLANVQASFVRNPLSSETSTGERRHNADAMGTWQPVISTTITIPAGYSADVVATFGAESSCFGTTDTWCSVRITANAVEMEPAEGEFNAFGSTDAGTATEGFYEETSITRVLKLAAGTYTIEVESHIDGSGIQFRLDDLIVVAEAHLLPV